MSEMTKVSAADEKEMIAEAEAAVKTVAEARAAIGSVIYGQTDVVENTLVTLLAGGHALLVGVPGLAKTKLVETLGTVLGLDSGRIQFTPDLMPSDIVGSEILDQDSDGKRSFRFVKGPIFAQLLMADEINRASPRTQSALLQAMQEYHVTIAGQRYDLPAPFHVLATQNPLEQEGTYPLPEAQLDRFMFMVQVGYPDAEEEREILKRTTGGATQEINSVVTAAELEELQAAVREIPVADAVLDYALSLTRGTRVRSGESIGFIKENVSWGAGPRASQFLILGGKAQAALDGRSHVSIEDIRTVAKPVLRHRIVTNFTAQAEGITSDHLIERLVDEDGALRKFVNVFVDDDDVRYLDGLDTKVDDGLTVSIIPAVAGG